MNVLVTSKKKEDPNKTEGARVATTINIDFFTQSRADNSAIKGRIWLKFELIRDVMAILVTSKYEEDSSKLKALEWPQHKLFIFQTLKGSSYHSQRSDLAEIRTHPRYYSCTCYLQE